MLGFAALVVAIIILILGIRGSYKMLPPWQHVGTLAQDVNKSVQNIVTL